MSVNKVKVSVIVPIYNAGKNLTRCLDTLVNQTLRDIEIILVLDCPTDGSDLIAKSYAKADDRIIILENEHNLHIGESRNRGMDVARGEYLHFSDHDDYRELDMLEKMYKKAIDDNLDVLISNPVSVIDGVLKEYNTDTFLRDRDAVLRHLLRGGNDDEKHPWSYYVYIHNILYRRSLIVANNIKFVDTRKITPEDYIFNVECLVYAKEVGEIKQNFYYHLLLSESEGHNSSYYTGVRRSSGFVYMSVLLQKKGVLEVYKADFYHNLVKNHIFLLFRAIEINHSFMEFCRCIRFYRKNKCVVDAFRLYKPMVIKEYQGWKKQVVRFLCCLVISCNRI